MSAFDDVIRNAMFAADTAAINTNGTGAAKTRAAVTEAFKLALGNGLITITDPDTWPDYVALDPPYDPTRLPWMTSGGAR